MLTLLLDAVGARELSAWGDRAQQGDGAVADALAACAAAAAADGPEDAPAGAGAGRPEGDPYPAGRPLADVLRAALGSLGAAEPGPGGEPKQAAGGAGACRGGARLALAELVGLTRRARVVVLRPAAPDSAPAPALLAELAGAARALDAALDLAAPMEARARRTRSQQSHAHQGRGPAQAEDLLQTRQRRWIAPGRKAHANQASLWH